MPFLFNFVFLSADSQDSNVCFLLFLMTHGANIDKASPFTLAKEPRRSYLQVSEKRRAAHTVHFFYATTNRAPTDAFLFMLCSGYSCVNYWYHHCRRREAANNKQIRFSRHHHAAC